MNRVRGVMAVWNDLEPGHEAPFEDWYQRQHLPERLNVPGFREARRYVALDGGSPRYCAFYWLDDVAVLASTAYRERLAQPSAATRQVMPWFRSMARTPCVVVLDRGAGVGGVMTWIACMDGEPDLPPTDVLGGAFACAPASAGLVGLHVWQCDRGLVALDNPEQRLRAGGDRFAHWIVCLEGTDERALQALARTLTEAIRPTCGNPRLIRAPSYRLLACLRAEEAPAPCADSVLQLFQTAGD